MNDHLTISLVQLFEMFPDNDAARRYLESRLWPQGVRCPECKQGERITARKGGYYRCNPCQSFDFTWRTGTIFERSHLSTQTVLAIFAVFGEEPDISPRQLADLTHITDKTACLALQRLRAVGGEMFAPRLDLSNPQYRVLEDFPAYRVGEDGSIWTRWKRSKTPRLGWSWTPLKTYVNRQRGGYRYATLYNGRRQQQRRVARLICEAFYGPCPSGMECCHRDGDPLQDAASNLYWGTPHDNMRDAKSHGRLRGGTARGERNGNAKLSDNQVVEITSLRGRVERRVVATRFSISRTRVSQIWKTA